MSTSLLLLLTGTLLLSEPSTILEYEIEHANHTVDLLEAEVALSLQVLHQAGSQPTATAVAAARHSDFVAKLKAHRHLAKLLTTSQHNHSQTKPTVIVIIPGFSSNPRLQPFAAFEFADGPEWDATANTPIPTAGPPHTKSITRFTKCDALQEQTIRATSLDERTTAQLQLNVAHATERLSRLHQRLILRSPATATIQQVGFSQVASPDVEPTESISRAKDQHRGYLQQLKQHRLKYSEHLLSTATDSTDKFHWPGVSDHTISGQSIPTTLLAPKRRISNLSGPVSAAEIEIAHATATMRVDAAYSALHRTKRSCNLAEEKTQQSEQTTQQQMMLQISQAAVAASEHQLALRRAELRIIIAVRHAFTNTAIQGGQTMDPREQLVDLLKLHSQSTAETTLAESRIQLDRWRLTNAEQAYVQGNATWHQWTSARVQMGTSEAMLQRIRIRSRMCRAIARISPLPPENSLP